MIVVGPAEEDSRVGNPEIVRYGVVAGTPRQVEICRTELTDVLTNSRIRRSVGQSAMGHILGVARDGGLVAQLRTLIERVHGLIERTRGPSHRRRNVELDQVEGRFE